MTQRDMEINEMVRADNSDTRCPECGSNHEPSGARSDCINHLKSTIADLTERLRQSEAGAAVMRRLVSDVPWLRESLPLKEFAAWIKQRQDALSTTAAKSLLDELGKCKARLSNWPPQDWEEFHSWRTKWLSEGKGEKVKQHIPKEWIMELQVEHQDSAVSNTVYKIGVDMGTMHARTPTPPKEKINE